MHMHLLLSLLSLSLRIHICSHIHFDREIYLSPNATIGRGQVKSSEADFLSLFLSLYVL